MALILNKLIDSYNYVFVELADPRVESYFLMSSPIPVMCLLGFYHYFIFKLGPRLMKNRPPYDIENILLLYNFVQVVANLFLVIQGFRYTLFTYSFMCEPIDYSYNELPLFITRHVWMYFMLKVLDLLDTVFFVLRKKINQITFLHVYHHTGMCLLGWFGVKYLAGGHGLFIGILNGIVHVVMYFYYLLSAWDKEYKKNIWWKKHITQIQIAQFFILILYFSQILFQPNCKYPKWVAWVFVPQNIIMIILFSNFYIKNYIKPEQKNKKNEVSHVNNGKQTELNNKKEA